MACNLDLMIESIGKKEEDRVREIQTARNKATLAYEEESDTDSEAEAETGMKTRKKRQHFTNDELLYDPKMGGFVFAKLVGLNCSFAYVLKDEQDEKWLNEKRAA
jgi:hypothetical protein